MKEELQEAKRALSGMMRAYFVDRDVEGTLRFAAEDIYSVGLGQGTAALGREALQRLIECEIAADPEPYEIREERFEAKAAGTGVTVLYRLRVGRPGEAEQTICQTASLQKEQGAYRVSVTHTSLARQRGNGGPMEQALQEKQAQLEQARRTLRELSDSIPGGIGKIALDDGLTLIEGNEALFALYGYTRQQMMSELGNRLADAMPADELRALRSAMEAARREAGGFFEVESRISRRDGSRADLLIRGAWLGHQSGDMVRCMMVDITGRKRMERALRLSEERFRVALSKTSNTIFDYHVADRSATWPEPAMAALGLPRSMEEMPEAMVKRGSVLPEFADDWLKLYQRIGEGANTASGTVKMRDAQGSEVWFHITLTALEETGQAIGILEDVTRQKEREVRYRQREQYRKAMLAEAVVYLEMNVSRNQVELCQGDWEYLPPEAAQCQSYDGLMTLLANQAVFSQDREAYEQAYNRQQVLDSFEAGAMELRHEHRWVRQDGTVRWVANMMHMLQDADTGDTRGFAYIRDIDRQKREELALRYRSERDALTGLYNKRQTEQMIKRILQTSPPDTGHAFFMIDMDHLKEVNDTCGHMAGDALLADCARQLSGIFRHDDVIGRIGGDEFVVFVRDIVSPDFVAEKARQIGLALGESAEQARMGVACTCSVGAALYPRDGQGFEQLYQRADIALYEAKRRGRNLFVFYDPSFDHGQWTPQWRTAIDSEAGR